MMKRLLFTLTLLALSWLCYAAYQSHQIETGYVMLPEITGLYYETSSGLTGYTENGQFEYKLNDTITFALGNEQQHFQITTLASQPVISVSQLFLSPKHNNNFLTVLVSQDQQTEDKTSITLAPERLADSEFQLALSAVNWQGELTELAGQALPQLRQVEAYIKHNPLFETYNEIVFAPLNKVLSTAFVALQNYNGELCFYDLARQHEPDYQGPIGHLTFKVTNQGVYSYPDIGDRFNNCDVDLAYSSQEVEFIDIDTFIGFGGLFRCALTGCTQSDLSGFDIDDREDEGDYKYRTQAMSFDSNTQIVSSKSQGLGPTENIKHSNLRAGLTFTMEQAIERDIHFTGTWLETAHQPTGQIQQQCLWFKHGQVLSAKAKQGQCVSGDNQLVDSEHYRDMWWLTESTAQASLPQLNAIVKWYDDSDTAHYTRWEYLPVGTDWQNGTLYRFALAVWYDQAGRQQHKITSVTEYKKVAK